MFGEIIIGMDDDCFRSTKLQIANGRGIHDRCLKFEPRYFFTDAVVKEVFYHFFKRPLLGGIDPHIPVKMDFVIKRLVDKAFFSNLLQKSVKS